MHKANGHVCLVGAGPGDPGLITVAGLDRLRRAEVVVYDALANPALLDEAPAAAERIDAGKRARRHRLTQDETNALLVDLAQKGRFVVRLKGGDPYLFGRGAEEAAYLGRHGVSVEVIPGVTSGIAAPALAGIPVTHRAMASTVTFVTGHEDPTKGASAIDYAALAGLIAGGGTACFYMGVGRLGSIVHELISRGLSAETPAAVVQWGTTPRQRQTRGTLASIVADVEREGLGPPAIVVVGQVAGIAEPGLNGFTERPLFGRTVMITRTRRQASGLRRRLEELGAEVLEAPTIELVPPASWEEVDAALLRVREFDWIVLTSENGVDALADRLDALGLDGRHLGATRLAAVGDATAEALSRRLALKADFVPSEFVGESLARELIAQHGARGRRFLLLRADIARPALPEALIKAGGEVTEVTAYQTRVAEALPGSMLEALRGRRVGWVTFTSASTVRNLLQMLGPERELLGSVRLASIGPVTSAALRNAGLEPTVEAATAGVDNLVAAIVAAG